MTMQMPFEPKGVIPACLLPFKSDMEIDEKAFEKLCTDILNGKMTPAHVFSAPGADPDASGKDLGCPGGSWGPLSAALFALRGSREVVPPSDPG